MRQSLRMLARDWRAGELRVLAAALVVAVAGITSVGFFADRIGRGLARDAHQLLGADLVLFSDHPFEPRFAQEIAALGLERSSGVNFVSMAIAGEKSQLAGVKAVGEGYELGPKRRYRHSEAYLRQEAASTGLEVMGLLDCSPREEARVAVAGFAVALQRSDG